MGKKFNARSAVFIHVPKLALAKRKRYALNPIRVKRGNRMFASLQEADRWQALERIQCAGRISELQFKPCLKLTEAEIEYVPSFRYREDDRIVYEFFIKAMSDKLRLVKKLWTHYGHGVLRISTYRDDLFVIAEEIVRRRLPEDVSSDGAHSAA